MRFAHINPPPIPLFLTFQEKLSKLRFDPFVSLDNVEPVEDSVSKYIDEYKRAVDRMLDVQTRMDQKKDEVAEFEKLVRSITHKTPHTQKLVDIIDDMVQNAGIEALQNEYTEASRDVAKFTNIFRICKSMDTSNKYVCYICLERPSDVLLHGCNHILCDRCANRIGTQCPFCRSTIKEKLKMFID